MTDDRVFLILNSYNEKTLNAETEWFLQEESKKTALPVDENGDVCVPDKKLVIIDHNGELISNIDLIEAIAPFHSVPQICSDGTNAVVITACPDAYTFETYYYKTVFSEDGTIISRSYLEVDKFYTFLSIAVNSDGDLYALVHDEDYYFYILKYDKNGRLINKSEDAASNCNKVLLFDNNVFCVVSRYNDDMNIETYLIDSDERINGEDNNKILIGTDLPESVVFCSCKNGILISYNHLIYALFDGEKETKLIFDDDLVTGINHMYMYLSDDNRLIIIGNNGMTGTLYECTVTETDEDPNASKECINVIGVNISEDLYLRNMAFRFNISNDDYYVKLTDFESDSGSNDSAVVNNELMRSLVYERLEGKHIDIIADTNGTFPFVSLKGSGFLSNEEGSVEFGRYYICALLGSKELLNPGEEMCFERSLSPKDGKIFIVNHSPEELLNIELMMSLDKYVDYGKGTCNFNNDHFISLLRWCKKQSVYNDQLFNDYKLFDELNNGNIETDLRKVYSQLEMNYYTGVEQNLSLYGIPSDYGSTILIMPIYCFAITSDCICPDKAEEFIDLIYDYETNFANSNNGFSITDDMNNLLESSQISADSISVAQYDLELTNIICEEASYYFYGNKEPADCAEAIQQRASILLSER